MKTPIPTLILLTSLALAPVLPAAISFTITATADHTTVGYDAGCVLGQADTLTFVTAEQGSHIDVGNSYFTSTGNDWEEIADTNGQLFADINGTAVTGSFVRPTPYFDTSLYIYSNTLEINTYDENGGTPPF